METSLQNQIGSSMLPFVMKELVEMIMRKKALPLHDALFYIYSSRLYTSLLDENTKLWYASTVSLYEMLEKERHQDVDLTNWNVNGEQKHIQNRHNG